MLAEGPRQPDLMASAANLFMKSVFVVVSGVGETETGRNMDGSRWRAGSKRGFQF